MQVGINESIYNIARQDTRNNSSSNSNSNKHYRGKRNPLNPDYEGPNGNKNTISPLIGVNSQLVCTTVIGL